MLTPLPLTSLAFVCFSYLQILANDLHLLCAIVCLVPRQALWLWNVMNVVCKAASTMQKAPEMAAPGAICASVRAVLDRCQRDFFFFVH